MKEIKIYELIELIKERKPPYEVIYQGTHFYIDDLDDYYKDRELRALLEYVFDNHDDFAALEEKVQIVTENDGWCDIEQLNYTLPSAHEKGKLLNKDGNYNTLRKIDITILEKVNQLINNQKVLKEKLEVLNDNNNV